MNKPREKRFPSSPLPPRTPGSVAEEMLAGAGAAQSAVPGVGAQMEQYGLASAGRSAPGTAAPPYIRPHPHEEEASARCANDKAASDRAVGYSSGCSCKQGKGSCLRMYCPCFYNSRLCSDNCRCEGCSNYHPHAPVHNSSPIRTSPYPRSPYHHLPPNYGSPPAQMAMGSVYDNDMVAATTSSNVPPTQVPRATAMPLNATRPAPFPIGLLSDTCSCKKSKCIARYCQCYASALRCKSTCTCNGCLNQESPGSSSAKNPSDSPMASKEDEMEPEVSTQKSTVAGLVVHTETKINEDEMEPEVSTQKSTVAGLVVHTETKINEYEMEPEVSTQKSTVTGLVVHTETKINEEFDVAKNREMLEETNTDDYTKKPAESKKESGEKQEEINSGAGLDVEMISNESGQTRVGAGPPSAAIEAKTEEKEFTALAQVKTESHDRLAGEGGTKTEPV
jgi:hypothetical protein